MKPLLEFDGDDIDSVRAARNYTIRHLASVFGVSERTVYRWKVEGAPPHIAVVLDLFVSREVRPQNVKQILGAIGKSRRDGSRYN